MLVSPAQVQHRSCSRSVAGARGPRVPWYAKALFAAVAAYALSPIDLIPDFIPILGYLDDLLVVPFGIWSAVKLIPEPIMADLRAKALEQRKPLQKQELLPSFSSGSLLLR